MEIQLIGSKIEELSLIKSDDDIEKMEFAVSTGFSKEELKTFVVIFKLRLKVDSGFILSVHHISQFKTNEDIMDEDRASLFFSINAPAIAYPFLRAFVANTLLSSGFEPAILPTINFVNLSNPHE